MPSFDRGAAAAGLGSVKPQACKGADGPTGQGHVTVTFAPSGKVILAQLDEGPFGPTGSSAFVGTSVERCLVDAYEKVSIPPFSGQAIHVGKSFRIE